MIEYRGKQLLVDGIELNAIMRHYLRQLQEQHALSGYATWRPRGAAQRSARAMAARGLIRSVDAERWPRWELTEAGARLSLPSESEVLAAMLLGPSETRKV